MSGITSPSPSDAVQTPLSVAVQDHMNDTKPKTWSGQPPQTGQSDMNDDDQAVQKTDCPTAPSPRKRGRPRKMQADKKVDNKGVPTTTGDLAVMDDNVSAARLSVKRKRCSSPAGEWTEVKREILMDRVIAAGYRALDLKVLAAEVRHLGRISC